MPAKIQDIEHCFNDLNILIIGDVILDYYLIGSVERISPEAPVPVVLHEQDDYRLGGAANVALNIRAMGANPYLLALIGEDYYASIFKDLLRKQDISSEYLLVDENRLTTCKTRILARNQQLLRYDRETLSEISPILEFRIFEQVQQLIKAKKNRCYCLSRL